MHDLVSSLASLLTDPYRYTRHTAGVALRPYQLEPIPHILASIRERRGDTFIFVFPRQSGKDETLVNLQLHLLDLFSHLPVGIVSVNPTYKPQTLNAILRFDQVIARNPLTRNRWRKRGDFMRLLGDARISFLSGDARSNVVGATASLLLVVNEAQDISTDTYYKKFVPMAASTNATRLLAGTVWTADTLLAREMEHARRLQEQDGRQRLFMLDADAVRRFLPAYGDHVDAMVARFGRQHPLVKSQYYNEVLDARHGMFTAAHLALIFTSNSPPVFEENGTDGHSPHFHSKWGQLEGGGCSNTFAFLLDLAGQDEALMADPASGLANPARDSAALTVVEIDRSTLETLQFPTYRVVHRQAWLGQNHLTLFGQLKALVESWRPLHIVMDATGVGEGLWALLDKAFPGVVIPVKFTLALKSEIGYRFLAVVNTGRFRDCSAQMGTSARQGTSAREGTSARQGTSAREGVQAEVLSQRVEAQYRACQSEVLPGPAKTLRWGVPEAARDSDGRLIHDDHLVADSLVVFLDDLDWRLSSPSTIIHRDILREIDEFERLETLFTFGAAYRQRKDIY